MTMQTIARLEQLPASCHFPRCCRDKIRFDAERKQLVFSGHMSLYEYQALIAVSDDVEYTLAIDWLFRNCDREDRAESGLRSVMRPWGWTLAYASAVVTVAAITLLVVLRGR